MKKKILKFISFAVGIFVCFFYYGVFQERINRGSYGDSTETKEKFECVKVLVFVQCVTNWMYAHFLLCTCMKQGEDKTSRLYLWSAAAAYLLAMVCSNWALQWVNYATQVIGKSAKPIPVLVLGALLGQKLYPIPKYIFVFLVVVGVALFMYQDGHSSQNSGTVFGMGEFLLLFSLTMDGVLGAVQDRMRADYKTKSLHMMSNINKWSFLFLGIPIVFTGEGLEFVNFVQRHPSIIWHLLSLSFACAQGQLFIFLMVEHFGPLACSIVTTTRKFFTILGSILIFGNSLTSRQWIATIIVFSGLWLDCVYALVTERKKEKNAQRLLATNTITRTSSTNVEADDLIATDRETAILPPIGQVIEGKVEANNGGVPSR